MSATPEQFVAEVRRWLDTPYKHRVACLGVGTDCANFVVASLHNLGLRTYPLPEYGAIPKPTTLTNQMKKYADFVGSSAASAKYGDVMLISWGLHTRSRSPHHLAVKADIRGRTTMIHAHTGIGRCVEHSLTDDWARCVVSVYRFKEVRDQWS